MPTLFPLTNFANGIGQLLYNIKTIMDYKSNTVFYIINNLYNNF